MTYRLSRRARDELSQIYKNGVAEFGVAHADAYTAGLKNSLSFLAQFPRAARERVEIDPPVRAHPYKAHLIVYVIQGSDILIVRIRHSREDWQRDQ
jgi:toxin ParE1/3/4